MSRGLLFLMLSLVSFAAVQAQTANFPTERVFVPGDAVNVTVVGERELTRSVTISTAGTISLGYAGEASIAGLTPTAAAKAVRTVLRRYLREPVVTVELAEYRFSVFGAVVRPGQFTMPRDRMPLLDALALAGGPADRANLRKVTLIRPTATGSQKMGLDLSRVIQDKKHTALPLMQPGDVLYIEKRKQPLGVSLLTILGTAASVAWVIR